MKYRKIVREKIIGCYEEKGLRHTLEIASLILKSNKLKSDYSFATDLHGEICESVLEIMIMDYCRRFSAQTCGWSYWKGIVLKNRMRITKDFSTEIDFVLCTPQCVYLFECKSYSGTKVLEKEGILVRQANLEKGHERLQCDVYRQNRIHYETLLPWISDFCLKGKEPFVRMCMFSFSWGSLDDRRSRAAKIEMPCLTAESLYQFLELSGEAIWDVDSLRVAFKKLDKLSDRMRAGHLAYVQNLHGKG